MLKPRYINAKYLLDNNFCTMKELQDFCKNGELKAFGSKGNRFLDYSLCEERLAVTRYSEVRSVSEFMYKNMVKFGQSFDVESLRAFYNNLVAERKISIVRRDVVYKSILAGQIDPQPGDSEADIEMRKMVKSMLKAGFISNVSELEEFDKPDEEICDEIEIDDTNIDDFSDVIFEHVHTLFYNMVIEYDGKEPPSDAEISIRYLMALNVVSTQKTWLPKDKALRQEGAVPFPFSHREAEKMRLTEDYDKIFKEIKFLRKDIERLFDSDDSSSGSWGLPALVQRMAQEGKTKAQIAHKLQEDGLSLSIIGALLHDRGMNKKGRFDSTKECADFYQKAAQALLAQETP